MNIHRKPICAAAVTLSCVLLLAAFTPAHALFGRKNGAPALSAFGKSDVSGSTICFSSADFTSHVRGDEELSAIVISALPESGRLCLAGREVLRGEAIESTRLGALSYVPDGEADEIHTVFSCIPVFSRTGAGSEDVSVALNLSAEANAAPVARDAELPTFVGVALCGELRAYDPDGDACTFTLTDAPKHGTVRISDGSFCYTPDSGRSGSDRFTFTATDAFGNVSAPAEVRVSVEKRADRDSFVYTDMADSSAHYAALCLREQGIFCGETLGGESFLYPDRPVSRAEFVALTAAVADLSLPTAAVGTGLSDNDDIPAWAQPYVAAAMIDGVITGQQDGSGNRVFRAQDAITRAEAAAIIDRAMRLPDDGRVMSFADTADVPAWAAQNVVNCTAAQLLPVFGDNTVRCGDAVTREDAVRMLYAMSQYQNDTQSGGLLRIFGK